MTKTSGRAAEELVDDTTEVWECALSHQAVVLEKLARWIELHEARPPGSEAGSLPGDDGPT